MMVLWCAHFDDRKAPTEPEPIAKFAMTNTVVQPTTTDKPTTETISQAVEAIILPPILQSYLKL
jgi:hypothetical protein